MSDLEQLVGFWSTSFDFGVCVISCGQRRGLSRDPPLSRTKISAVLLYLILLIMGLALSSERGIIVLGELCSTLEGYVTEQDHGSIWIYLLLISFVSFPSGSPATLCQHGVIAEKLKKSKN